MPALERSRPFGRVAVLGYAHLRPSRRGRLSSYRFHLACFGGAAPAGGADPGFRHRGVHDERRRQGRDQERPEPCVGRIAHGDHKCWKEDHALRGDSEPYGERPYHPSLCSATRPVRTWTKPLTRAKRNRLPKSPTTTLSGQPEKGITRPMNS